MQDLFTSGWSDYELIDTGDGKRLERFGKFFVVRPEPSALWKKSDQPEWNTADAVFDKEWKINNPALRESFEVNWNGLFFSLKLGTFRHTGMFPEQEPQWKLIQELCKAKPGMRVLNLFGYTGVASIVAAAAGASVCHVDASKVSVYLASDNAKRNGVESKIRWIVDDVLKFLQREVRRGNQYDLVLMDPPVFGRGPKGEIWRLEENLANLGHLVNKVLHPDAAGVFTNCYATELYPEAIKRTLDEAFSGRPEGQLFRTGITEKTSKKALQTGYCVRS